ncbi:MAG TPA: class I SAM-dependent methyltransferase [Ruminococcus sp.]|nr:class I SAM-dependent methyltransferase [Ruminococcus sp.]
MKKFDIDNGNVFDWGKTSQDYAKFRDIYPPEFYQMLIHRNIGTMRQNILDLGTGTGVIPRNMYSYGAHWTGIDIAENQIAQAQILAKTNNMQIDFQAVSAEECHFPENHFDIVTACQCFWYFDPEKLMPILKRILEPEGRLCILQMEWLPFEDKTALASENLVLKYNPEWSGAGETRHPVLIPEHILKDMELIHHEEWDIEIPFTRETWNGRMKACRGVGASLSESDLKTWEREHQALLERIVPQTFNILHYVAMAELRLK